MSARVARIAGLVLAACVLAGCARSPESTVERFYRAVEHGELTEAQTYLSSQILGMLGPQKAAAVMSEESERMQRCGGLQTIDVRLEGQGEIRSGTATVSYAGACASRTERVKLVKEDGKWKLAPNK